MTFVLLTVSPNERLHPALMQATASILEKPHGRFGLGLQDQVHPLRIGSGWSKLATIPRISRRPSPR